MTRHRLFHPWLPRTGKTIALVTALIGGGGLCGCEVIGLVNHVAQPTTEDASYKGLQSQTAGIMVWADNAVCIDHPTIQSDVARGVQDKLGQASSSDELKGTRFIPANTILRFQEDHPEMAGQGAGELTAAFSRQTPLTRMIYVELLSVSTHPVESVDLLYGNVKARVRVLEPNAAGAWKVVYEDTVVASYPDNAPPEGLPDLDEATVFQKTISELTNNISAKFVEHDIRQSSMADSDK